MKAELLIIINYNLDWKLLSCHEYVILSRMGVIRENFILDSGKLHYSDFRGSLKTLRLSRSSAVNSVVVAGSEDTINGAGGVHR